MPTVSVSSYRSAAVKIGVPREIKRTNTGWRSRRPARVELVRRGHDVLVESGAGMGARFPTTPTTASARGSSTRLPRCWGESELLLKVKEPIEPEYALLHAD